MADEKKLDEAADDQGATNAAEEATDEGNGDSSTDSTAGSDSTARDDGVDDDDGDDGLTESKSRRSRARTGALIVGGVIAAAAIVAAAVWAVAAVLDNDDDSFVVVDYATVAPPDFFLGVPNYGEHRDHHHDERSYRHHDHRHDHHGHRDDRYHRDGYRHHNYTDRQWGLNLAPLLWLLERFLGIYDWLRGYDGWSDDYRFDRDDRRYRDYDGWSDDWSDDRGRYRDDGWSDDYEDWSGRDGGMSGGGPDSSAPENGMPFGFAFPEGLFTEEMLDQLDQQELLLRLLREFLGNGEPFPFGFAMPESSPRAPQQDDSDPLDDVLSGLGTLDPDTLNELLEQFFGQGLPLNSDDAPFGPTDDSPAPAAEPLTPAAAAAEPS